MARRPAALEQPGWQVWVAGGNSQVRLQRLKPVTSRARTIPNKFPANAAKFPASPAKFPCSFCTPKRCFAPATRAAPGSPRSRAASEPPDLAQFPCKFPCYRELGRGERFAEDYVHRQLSKATAQRWPFSLEGPRGAALSGGRNSPVPEHEQRSVSGRSVHIGR